MSDMKPFGELSDAEKGALLLAHHEGKRIEYLTNRRPVELSSWYASPSPTWALSAVYRIAPDPLIPDSIDWSHVAPEYKFMARDSDGAACVFEFEPVIRIRGWGFEGGGYFIISGRLASYKRGTVDWRDSLVRRPS